MNKKLTGSFLLLIFSLFLHAQKNLTLRSNLKYTNKTLAGIWGHVDASGNEYALVAASNGLSIVDVTNPATPVEKFFVSSPYSVWHEVRTCGNYAYMCTEGGGGITIVDLSNLPASIRDTTYTGDGVIAGQVGIMHTLEIEKNFLYMFGMKPGIGGAYVADLTDPWKPKYVGKYDVKYVHDGYVRNDTLYAANINNGTFSIIDFTDKAAPVLLASKSTPKNKTHNCWLSDNGKTLFTTDEVDYSTLTSYDISDLSNIVELDRAESQPGSGSVVHNTRIFNDYSVTSWYIDGVVIVDCSRPSNMIKTAFYDTSPAYGKGQGSCWDVYPYLPSGNIIASTISEGLFVLAPTYKRACYLEGIVTDSATGAPINNVKVEIQATDAIEYSSLSGKYETGFADSGSYTVTFSVASHISKTITGVVLKNGVLTNLNISLAKRTGTPFNLVGRIMKSNGAAVVLGNVAVQDGDMRINVTGNGTGYFTINNIYPGTYQFTAGKWGYVTQCMNKTVTGPADTVKFYLASGIYDDFIFDYAWKTTTTTTSGNWKREKPRSTSVAGTFANPDADASADCSEECYVTGNEPFGDADFDDVENGIVTLTSPIFDLTTYVNPYVIYSRWYYNQGADPNPAANNLLVRINNNISTVTLENVSTSNPNWVSKKFRIKDYVSLTDSVKLIFRLTGTAAAAHVVESGVDHFMIVDSITSSVETIKEENVNFHIYPNPVNDGILYFSIDHTINNDASFTLLDLMGKTIGQYPVKANEGKLQFSNELSPGIYFIQYLEGTNSSFRKLIIQ
ncbi:MAG: choice-of-anchor B family protein [Bacteroidota bacterium]